MNIGLSQETNGIEHESRLLQALTRQGETIAGTFYWVTGKFQKSWKGKFWSKQKVDR